MRLATKCLPFHMTGNGFDIKANSVISGDASPIGSSVVAGSPKIDMNYSFISLSLQKGDMIAIVYGNNGDYRFDEGNANVSINTVLESDSTILFLGTVFISLALSSRWWRK